MVQPWQTVTLEHTDRKARLERLSQLRGIEPPEMNEEFVTPSEHGLPDYPTNIPVLRVVFRDGVLFDFDRDEVKPEAAEVLNTIAASLRLEPPDVAVFVAGHTDAIGSVEYNLGLGLRRAKAAARALAQIGVNNAQLFAISFGKAVPLAPNDTDDGRARNRRVEFLFAARAEAVAAWLARQPYVACGDKRALAGQECPTNLVFPAVSVRWIPPPGPPVHIGGDITPSHMGGGAPPVNMRPGGPPTHVSPNVSSKDIRVGDRVVDIDLRQKIFHFRAPE